MNISIFDIHVIDVYFTSVYSNPSVFDTSSVAKNSNSKRELQNEQRLVKGEVMMCVGSGSKIDMIIIAHCWKYALEAIIKLLFISLYHDKSLLFMLELY